MDFKGAKHEWRYDPARPDLMSEIVEATGASRVLADVLVAREIRSGGEALAFLHSDVGRLPHARLLPDAARVVERAERR